MTGVAMIGCVVLAFSVALIEDYVRGVPNAENDRDAH
jgi:hypothetical protein